MKDRTVEQEERFTELQQALQDTLKWVKGWHTNVRAINNLTTPYLKSIEEYGGHAVDKPIKLSPHTEHAEILYGVAVFKIRSRWGDAEVIQFDRQIEDPDKPLMARFFYEPGNFTDLISVSLGWRPSESDVLYESIDFSNGKIEKYNKTTRPGVLFPLPSTNDPELQRLWTQTLELEYSYDDKRVGGWKGRIAFERQGNSVAIVNGELDENNSPYRNFVYRGEQYSLPTTLDPIPHIRNFASRIR